MTLTLRQRQGLHLRQTRLTYRRDNESRKALAELQGYGELR
jgi:hypothetical protein